MEPRTVKEYFAISISSKKVKGRIDALAKSGGSYKTLQSKYYTSVEQRRTCVKILIGIWGETIVGFQIVPGK